MPQILFLILPAWIFPLKLMDETTSTSSGKSELLMPTFRTSPIVRKAFRLLELPMK